MSQRAGLMLTVVNLLLLALALSDRAAVAAQGVPDVLRARAWELVDERGGSRASLTLAPGGDVVLRLRDQTGTIRVKLAAGRGGSGLVLLDSRTELGVKLDAGSDGTALELTGRDGRQHVIRP